MEKLHYVPFQRSHKTSKTIKKKKEEISLLKNPYTHK